MQALIQQLHLQQQVETIEQICNRLLIVFDWNVTTRLEIGNLEGLSISLRKKLSCKMQGTLAIGVSVAIANYLILILSGKGLQAVMNSNEAEMDETDLKAKGKDNGGKSALFILKDTPILYDLLNLLLWL